MFVQLDDVNGRSNRGVGGGLGIGLALVRHLVQLHGGNVEALQRGPRPRSEFVVRLPGDGLRLRGRGSRKRPRPARASVERRILVVDDLPDNAASLTVLLRRLGHRVETAFSGRDALALADQFRPQIMLLDIGMPDLDGFEVCRRVRKEDWGKAMFIVALSGWGQE